MDRSKDFIEHYKELLHEIKSPLDIIRSHADYLMKNACKDAKETEEYLSIIIAETKRLEAFLNEVDESIKKVSLHSKFIDVNKIIKDVIKKLKIDIANNQANVELRLKSDLPRIYADKNKLERVLINLINNAIYAIEPGGSVIISTDSNELFYLKIKDNGAGIKRGAMKTIFNPFYTTKPEGTGLGLYIAKKIIDAHGGSINVTSEYGEGTEFLIILPLHHEE